MLKENVNLEKPIEFISSLVIAKENNDNLRIRLDPQHLSKQILREYFQLPTFEENCFGNSCASIFSILDANKVFSQIKLSEESSKLIIFNAAFGIFCFSILLYGICFPLEISHRAFSNVFKDISGIEIYTGNILILRRNEEIRLNIKPCIRYE